MTSVRTRLSEPTTAGSDGAGRQRFGRQLLELCELIDDGVGYSAVLPGPLGTSTALTRPREPESRFGNASLPRGLDEASVNANVIRYESDAAIVLHDTEKLRALFATR
jgi:hypothetical protein